MSITEIIPAVRALPRNEKFRLVRLLLDDLVGEKPLAGIKQGQEFAIFSTRVRSRSSRPTRRASPRASKQSIDDRSHHAARSIPDAGSNPLKSPSGAFSSRKVS
ncbi:MAG TPA: hypothetical protein VMF69_11565 [Gemmataceae bacterium]|nr:hypothetical protein [Gemmataceae bacterium]